MPLTGTGRNLVLEKLAEAGVLGWVGLYTASAAVTGLTSTSATNIKKTAHGFVDDDLIYVKACTEGGTGSMFKTGQFLYVKKVDADNFTVSQSSTVSGIGFIAEKWTAEIKGTVEVEKMTEVSGAPYKRLKAEWSAISANGVIEDAKKHEVPCAEGTVVDAVSYHSNETEAGPKTLRGIEKVTKEPAVGASKVYAVNDTKLDALTL